MARKIGSFTPIWNQEMWIKPHFEMLSKLDRNVVSLQKRPLPTYHNEHGYSVEPDLSEQILRSQFPNVELFESTYPEGKEFGGDLYNEGFEKMQDCDIVFRLDPDMFFEDEVWDQLLDYIRNTDYDCYRMDFANDSCNYYMTGDFDHGLKDAQEMDPLAVNPKYPLETPILEKIINGQIVQFPQQFQYMQGNSTIIKFPGFFCHHFRGWNKPKSTPNPEWKNTDYARTALQLHGNDGDWYHCSKSVRQKVEGWQVELAKMKHG